MSTPARTVELPLTLHLTEEARSKLAQRAAAAGAELEEYVSQLVEQTARKPFSLRELSGDVHERFLASGTTDDQLAEELERAKHELRAERRAGQGR
ncbi:MAG: hypothetical protein QOE14_1160 [Humisphaera sp.]|nr:hypothetical protein [Humisphaera sp.]